MENALKIFEHPMFGQLRILDQNEDQWFVATDVARSLGYAKPNNAVQSHCKKVNKISYPVSGQLISLNIIPESDVHRLIMRAKTDKAEEYQDWVCGEVLPDIRKHGFYGTAAFVDKALKDTDSMIAILQNYKFEKERRALAEQQRDEAVRTKAWIGSRREATAMNRASVYSKECERLREEIGDSRKWKQVTAIPWLGDYFDLRDRKQAKKLYNILGRKLTAISRSMGYEVKKVASTEYETVNAYNVDALHVLRDRIEEEPGMLLEYRKQIFASDTTGVAQCG